MTAREIKRRKAEFGTGEVIYHRTKDYPYELDHGGFHWYRTQYEYTVTETGMSNYLYETFDTDDDVRLFIDAAGHIWDETELGIF